MRRFEMELAGRPLVVEVGQVAQLAKGSAILRYGETTILAVAGASKKPREGMDFFPLSVDYEEKQYAVGKIPGGFLKREGRPSEKAILNSRLIDRPIRPLFPKGFRNDVQVVTTVMAVEQDNAPEIVAMIGSSVALSISDMPFAGPTGSVAVGLVDGELVLNPTQAQREVSDLSLIVAGTKDAVMMVEAGANEVSEETMLEAILFAHDEIKKIVAFIEGIVAEVGVPKAEYKLYLPTEELTAEIEAYVGSRMHDAVQTADKDERLAAMNGLIDEAMAHFTELYPDAGADIDTVLNGMKKKEVRSLILNDRIRPDNRKMEEVRPISALIDFVPRVHGSGLFTRGETQVLSIATLGVLRDAQMIDGLGTETEKRYMHQYNFPSYSVGETRPMRGPGRREIGHGALAERALLPMVPSEEEFPYAIRVVSEVLSSNGSTSQASVCGSSLALMAAGVPLKKPVAGCAMGLIKENEKLAILTDIQGMEDFLGDMDFKVAGTADGITAIQMDIKIHGIDREILTQALAQAKDGRMHILGIMNDTIAEPREELSPYAPRIITMHIKPDKIREVIGSGGKVINGIIDETGVKIDIEDDGTIYIASEDGEAAKRAIDMINDIVREVEVGEVVDGTVVRIMNFGAFVSIPGGKDGLIHISKLEHHRVEKVEDSVKLGDKVTVKVIEIDDQGRINLSRKACLPKEN
ncbi:MAG: polyribonucleotide nucleotidyltransferase [Eubacterium aggregans]|uniref:Polyribonucleotide nucleotidyltransferase n=1 Tax=Eubacterium aggregans TaxID=81409 RepID=A0A1H3ZRB9_9FIRM|nr:polyribonucleotide nucleotidyltransferase [Eubacterium aggregans]MDD4691954.1 polyribonucleotide nucleotidyltransferase [Eubacterium aggregans]MEA5073914.1 polyribonucleotide nucleotidyltransferase [Eubacterium aggregans]SEA25832.1 polyribonucleotide nucleotidyltransferase [Eubacterium aggregans]